MSGPLGPAARPGDRAARVREQQRGDRRAAGPVHPHRGGPSLARQRQARRDQPRPTRRVARRRVGTGRPSRQSRPVAGPGRRRVKALPGRRGRPRLTAPAPSPARTTSAANASSSARPDQRPVRAHRDTVAPRVSSGGRRGNVVPGERLSRPEPVPAVQPVVDRLWANTGPLGRHGVIGFAGLPSPSLSHPAGFAGLPSPEHAARGNPRSDGSCRGRGIGE
jgi:hypothetical protein